jgi:hypothetical protein
VMAVGCGSGRRPCVLTLVSGSGRAAARRLSGQACSLQTSLQLITILLIFQHLPSTNQDPGGMP